MLTPPLIPDITHKTVVFSGGVGAARFLEGLTQVVPDDTVCALVNTGDDIEMHGLHISPDIDIVLCTLAGLIHPAQGWGVVDDTDHCMHMLGKLGAPTWFMLGDKDMAFHIQRSALLGAGWHATHIAEHFRRSLGVTAILLPMTHDHVHTHIVTPTGTLHFQEYLVRDRARAEIRGIEYHGIATAQPTAYVMDALRTAAGIIIAPSNPFVSVGTILALPGVRHQLMQATVPRIAISPIVGGAAIKGPAVAMLHHAGVEVSAYGIASIYRECIDGMVIDEVDAALAPRIAALGLKVCVTDTIMRDRATKQQLATTCLKFMAELQ